MPTIEKRLVNLLEQRGYTPNLKYGKNGYWLITFPYEIDGRIECCAVSPHTNVADLWFLDDDNQAVPVKFVSMDV